VFEAAARIGPHPSEAGSASWRYGAHLDRTIALPPEVPAALKDALSGRRWRNPVATTTISG